MFCLHHFLSSSTFQFIQWTISWQISAYTNTHRKNIRLLKDISQLCGKVSPDSLPTLCYLLLRIAFIAPHPHTHKPYSANPSICPQSHRHTHGCIYIYVYIDLYVYIQNFPNAFRTQQLYVYIALKMYV